MNEDFYTSDYTADIWMSDVRGQEGAVELSPEARKSDQKSVFGVTMARPG